MTVQPELAKPPDRHTATPPARLRLVLPYLRAELPMWGRVYSLVGGTREDLWRGCGRAEVRGKLHGYRMDLDLSNWSERLTYCLGRYHDLPIQRALQQVLRAGDVFVDVGANLGLLTLLGSRLVGAAGAVLAVEPNPALHGRIARHLEGNQIANVQLVGAALGDAPGVAELREYGGHTGWGSLAAVGPDGAVATRVHRVPVRVGDDLCAALPDRPMVFKIDVEGYEVPVLRGLRQTLAKRLPMVFLEVADSHQRRAGFSAAELRGELERLGYRGFGLTMPRTLFGRRLHLQPLTECHAAEVDAVFVPPSGPMAGRLGP